MLSSVRRALVFVLIASFVVGCTPAGEVPSDAGMDALVVPDAVWWFPDSPFILPDVDPPSFSDADPDGEPTFFFDGSPVLDWDGGPQCPFFCTADVDCASTCPMSVGTSACCDLQTHTCYYGLSCPSPFLDGGIDAATDAACLSMPTSVQVTFDAPGLPGTLVSIIDNLRGTVAQTHLDASGHGVLTVSLVGVTIDGSGRSRIVDGATGTPFTFDLASAGSSSLSLTVATQIDAVHDGFVSAVSLVIRREPTSGACVASIVSATQDCAPHAGLYDPSRFDDQPCGPFH